MRKSLAYLVLSLMTAFIVFGFTSCLNSNAEEPKKISVQMNNGQFQCRSIGAYENCGMRLIDCTDGLRRFDVLCAVNVTVERW